MRNEVSSPSSGKRSDGTKLPSSSSSSSNYPSCAPSPSVLVRSEDFIPIPSQRRVIDIPSSFVAPSSLRNLQTPSSWGGASVLLNDEASVYGDERSDRGTDVSSAAGLTYARKRRLLRQLSKSSISAGTPRQKLHAVKERWTKKLEDYRVYEAGLFKSWLPFKAAFGASLAACLCFAPFIPNILTYYGTVAVLGVDMSLESNVGLTLQKGLNLMLGSALAGACALVVSSVEPFTGSFKVYYLVTFVFLGGCLPRLISLPKIIKTRWAQTLTYYIIVFHSLILNKSIKMEYTGQFFANCLCYSTGFLIVVILTLCIKPEYAGDALLVLLVSDFHTAGVVLERIVEDYKSGLVLTKIQELLSGVVTEDHIHHDLQYIMKSTAEVEKLMDAVRWEPPHGKFFRGYPWDLFPTLLAMLLHVLYDLISLDSALRAEIQAPVDVRQLFAEEMEIVARECSMSSQGAAHLMPLIMQKLSFASLRGNSQRLFHKVGDALLEHKKLDYHSNVERARLATLNLRSKLSRFSPKMVSENIQQQPSISRAMSGVSVKEDCEGLPISTSTPVTPLPSPQNVDSVLEQEPGAPSKITTEEMDWQARLFLRRQSIAERWPETQQQISSLSFIKFASILIEFMGKVKTVVTMVDQIAVQARFSDVP